MHINGIHQTCIAASIPSRLPERLSHAPGMHGDCGIDRSLGFGVFLHLLVSVLPCKYKTLWHCLYIGDPRSGYISTQRLIIATQQVNHVWELKPDAKCYGYGSSRPSEFSATYESHTAINMILDVIVLIIPMPLLFKEGTGTAQRLRIGALLFMGNMYVSHKPCPRRLYTIHDKSR